MFFMQFHILSNYTGNRQELGTAEKFLISVIQIPEYKTRWVGKQ